MAGWGEMATKLAKVVHPGTKTQVIKSLALNSEILDRIQNSFEKMIAVGDFFIHTFQEGRPIMKVGKVCCAKPALQPCRSYLTTVHCYLGCRRLFFKASRLPRAHVGSHRSRSSQNDPVRGTRRPWISPSLRDTQGVHGPPHQRSRLRQTM